METTKISKIRRILRFFKKFGIILKIILAILVLGFYCEFGIYYLVLLQCSWPKGVDSSPNNGTLKAMFLADTHLLGPFRGHWFDKLRREWQMYRAFQTAMSIFPPEAVFFLGDVFDEGMWVDIVGFDKYVQRFDSLFYVPQTTKRYVIAGNHDMGFHYVITPELSRRFSKAFKSYPIQTVRLKGNTFVLINSMAMEQDGCFLCEGAIKKIHKLSERFQCEQDSKSPNCDPDSVNREYSQPILLQHFPLYRHSDKSCTGPDSAPESEKNVPFRQTWDCVSKESSDLLLKSLNPRLVLSGHTHHGCLFHHENKKDASKSIPEYSIPSFSWRNRNNPSFYLGIFTKDDYALEKCYMPEESTVKTIYWIGMISILYYFIISRFLSFRFIYSRCVRLLGTYR